MDRSRDPDPHPTHSPPRLRDVALAMLRLHWPAVRDVGDAPYALLHTLLPLSSASQLADLEHNSPHLVPHTNPIWRQLCVNEFIEIRKAVEDGQISQDDEPESWKEQYDLEAIKREEKMQAIVSKMRGQINEYKHGRATTKEVDWRVEKRRKTASSSTAPTRPKTLMEKARHNTKQIKSIYAPRRVRPVPPPPKPVISAAGGAPTSFAPRPPPPSTTASALSSGSLFVTRSPSRRTKAGPALSTSAAAAADSDQQQLRKRSREETTTSSASDSSTRTTLFNNANKKPQRSNAASSSSSSSSSSSPAVKITTTTTTTSAPAKQAPSFSSRPSFSPPPPSPPKPSTVTKKSTPMTTLGPPSRPRPIPGPGLAPMLPPSTSTSTRPVVVPRGIFMPKSKR